MPVPLPRTSNVFSVPRFRTSLARALLPVTFCSLSAFAVSVSRITLPVPSKLAIVAAMISPLTIAAGVTGLP